MVAARTAEVRAWLVVAAPLLAHDDAGVAALVAAEPDAFLDLAEALPEIRRILTGLLDLSAVAELRVLAGLARLDVGGGG